MSLSSTANFVNVTKILSATWGSGTMTVRHSGSANGNECAGTGVFSFDTDNNVFDSWVANTWNGGAGTTGDCLGTPPVSQWCAMVTPSILFDYGTMVLTDASDKQEKMSVDVECTAGMNYTLRLSGVDSIPLSNGMSAELTAGGLPLNSSLAGSVGTNPVEITSTLTGTPTSAGAFSGTGVLFVSYP